jgi:hypothetical protein
VLLIVLVSDPSQGHDRVWPIDSQMQRLRIFRGWWRRILWIPDGFRRRIRMMTTGRGWEADALRDENTRPEHVKEGASHQSPPD